MSDLDARWQWVAAQGGDIGRLGVTGCCWGGRAAWLYAAHNPACRAAAAWNGRIAKGHGALQVRHPINLAHDLHGPVLGLFGHCETGIPHDDVRTLENLLSQGNEGARPTRMSVYAGAGHENGRAQ